MSEILSKLDGGEILGLCGIAVGLIAILGGISVAITKAVATYHRRTQLDEMEAMLKMEMITRGMSADDIKQVLEARMATGRGTTLGDLIGALPQMQMNPMFRKHCNKS